MMDNQELADIAYAPYEKIKNPSMEDWKKSYDALIQLIELDPENAFYPNTLGYICFYGRHTGTPAYEEARAWFEKGNALGSIESSYKLADMLKDGMGGPEDKGRAYGIYKRMYMYCRNQFESGDTDCKFADVALRLARVFHEGINGQVNELNALAFALEAQYAIALRRKHHEYGDAIVQKNIDTLLNAIEKPEYSIPVQEAQYYGVNLPLIAYWFINDEHFMVFDIDVAPNGLIRLVFHRIHRGNQPANPVLWPVPALMKCILTKHLTVYGENVRLIWRKDPDKDFVICDRYGFDEETGTHEFYFNHHLLCRLGSGKYLAPISEITETSDKNG